MSFIEPFEKVVTLTKRNHRYYGPTESIKFRGAFTEIACDLGSIFEEVTKIRDAVIDLSAAFLSPSGSANSLYDLKKNTYYLENKLEKLIYIRADQAEILE